MDKNRNIPWKKIFIALLALGILVTLIASLWRNNVAIFTVLTFAAIAVFVLSKRKRTEALTFVVSGSFGPTMEIIIIHFGAWQYSNPTFLGIPIWLPLLWGLTGVFLMKISRWMAL